MLTDHLPFARDAGIHFLIARTTAGVSRALFEPFLQRIKELGAQGLILSGDPHEGDILGTTRPHPMPPGRAHFVSRKRGTPLVQLGWLPISRGARTGAPDRYSVVPPPETDRGVKVTRVTGALNAAAIPFCACHSVRHVPTAKFM